MAKKTAPKKAAKKTARAGRPAAKAGPIKKAKKSEETEHHFFMDDGA